MGRQQAEMAAQQKCKTRYRFTKALLSHLRWYGVLTLWAPMGGKAPALGIGPTRGLLVGGGGLAPFVVGLHEWSVKRVLMSGFGRGFLQSWCCQFKLKENEDHLRNNSHTREQGATRRHDALYFPTKKTTRVTEMERKKEECNIRCANWSIIYQISKGKNRKKKKNNWTDETWNNLWFIRVLSLELLKAGKVSLSRKRGFASISFLSSISIIFRADLVSPYFDSCSFCLSKSTVGGTN